MIFFLGASYYVVCETAYGEINLSQKPNHDAKNIGARFRSARSLVPNLNRKSFCERYEINRYTMQSWENGLHVSKGKNVEKFIEALSREGVFCTSEWLFDGTGEPARPLNGAQGSSKVTIAEIFEEGPSEKFSKIIDDLKKIHRNIDEDLISLLIDDDAMAPKFLRGDTVLGLPAKKDRDRLHQKYCIIELNPERRIVRKVLLVKDNLILLALDERCSTMTLGNTVNVFEIIWHLLPQ
jgi:hypothetical protein